MESSSSHTVWDFIVSPKSVIIERSPTESTSQISKSEYCILLRSDIPRIAWNSYPIILWRSQSVYMMRISLLADSYQELRNKNYRIVVKYVIFTKIPKTDKSKMLWSHFLPKSYRLSIAVTLMAVDFNQLLTSW